MKKIFGWIFIIAGIGNIIKAVGMASQGVLQSGGQNTGGIFLFGIGFIILGLYMIGAFKDSTSKTHVPQQVLNTKNKDEVETSKTERFSTEGNTINDYNIHLKPDTKLSQANIPSIKTSLKADNNNVGLSIGEQLRLKLFKELKQRYQTQFGSAFHDSYIDILADKVSTISKSYSDTSISIMNVKGAIERNMDMQQIKDGLISISKNYSLNNMQNLGSVGEIFGKQIIDIPHLTSNQSNIPLDLIYQQGYELLALGQQTGIEREVLEILSLE